jgi:NAD(P)H-hydrate epimerase
LNIRELTHSDVLEILPERDVNAHKGDFGRILLLCGSKGYTGAAALAAMGALRTGAGLVFLGVPECIYSIEAIKLTEPVVFALPDNDGKFSENSISAIQERMQGMDAILIGPGMGISNSTFKVVEMVLREYSGPVVLDADGINVLCGHIDILRGRTGTTILTPHAGEFFRIAGEVPENRISSAVNFARQSNSVLLLKGHQTVVTDGHSCYLNNTGNSGMAVGGCGDVLAGMITALLGQGIDPLKATACAAWLHGAAGDICAKEIGQYGMLPSDMLNSLPRLLK